LSLPSPNEHTVQPPKIAFQPPFSTIPCNSLYLLANPVLPFLMFSSLSVSFANRSPRPRLTPFPASLTDKSQLAENPATLSSFAATLTRRVKHKSFACHPYKKHPGSHPSSQIFSFRSLATHQSRITKSFIIRTYAKSAHKLFRMNTSKTQDLKPFRMNTSEKTGVGGPLISPHPCAPRPSNHAVSDTEESLS
jgi:hypothetical protein